MKSINLLILPVNILAFLRVAISFSIGLAVPLYLIQLSISSEVIGIINSGTSMIYLFSPILFRNVFLKIGVKKTLILSSAGFFIELILFQILLFPLAIYLLLIVDGLLLGLFWPLLTTIISNLSDTDAYRNNDKAKDNLMKTYGLSWNIGGIFSLILGAYLLFNIANPILMFRISLLYGLVGFITSLFYKEAKEEMKHQIVLPFDERIKIIPRRREEIIAPLFIPLLLIWLFGFSVGFIQLAYPLKSTFLGFPLYSNYFIYFIRMTAQTIIIMLFINQSMKLLKKVIPLALISLLFSFIIMVFSGDLISFSLLFGIFGAANAILYSFSFKLMVFKNITNNTSKYSSYFETMVGIGLFISPIIGGFLVFLNINMAFLFPSFISFITLIIYIIFRTKIELN